MDQEGETPVFRSDAIRRASVNPYDGKDEEQSATTINTTNVVQLRSAGPKHAIACELWAEHGPLPWN